MFSSGGCHDSCLGRAPKGAYSSRGRSRHLLETPFSEPLLRTLLRTLFYCKTHRKRPPSQNPSENPFPRTLPRTFSEPFLECCVALRPLRRAPNCRLMASVLLVVWWSCWSCYSFSSCARGPPQFLRKRSEHAGANENVSSWVHINSENRSGGCSADCGFRIAPVVRCHSENGIFHSENQFLNSESCSENTPVAFSLRERFS